MTGAADVVLGTPRNCGAALRRNVRGTAAVPRASGGAVLLVVGGGLAVLAARSGVDDRRRRAASASFAPLVPLRAIAAALAVKALGALVLVRVRIHAGGLDVAFAGLPPRSLRRGDLFL